MSTRFLVLAAVTAAFTVLTVLALEDVGFVGIIRPHFQSWGGGQVLADLVIMGVLVMVWMVRDARERGVSVWPFVVLTLVAGSFGPLAYLLLREMRWATKRPALA